MAKKTNKNEDELEKLRIENELKKAKMMLEQGAVFSEPGEENNLHPAIEAEFLDNIEQFEKAHQNAKRIPVYEFIGNPAYRETASIPDAEIGTELDRIMNIMEKNGVSLSTICEVDDRVLYRFIVEELFVHEMDDVRIKGMMSCFTYEEFHPNHEYDIRDHSTDFIRDLFNKETDWYKHLLTSEAEKDKWFENFREAYRKFSLKYFDIKSVGINNEHAKVVYEIQFTAYPAEGNKTMKFSGEGTMELYCVYDYWCIHSIKFPPVS